MSCKSKVCPDLAKAIQTVEDHLRAQKESVMLDLEGKMIDALMSGIALEDIEIIEHTVWTNKNRKAEYKSIVRKKSSVREVK